MSAPLPRAGLHISLLLPTQRDADITARILNGAGIATRRCRSVDDLAPDAILRSGAVMIAEEWLARGGVDALRAALALQPSWSDLPILIISRAGLDSAQIAPLLDQLGNATLLDRPLRVAAITSAARAALRARERQYQIRAQLAALEQAGSELALAARRKDEFLAMLGHELRNPLAPIRNAIHMLQALEGGGEQARQLLDIMQRQTDHMVRLVEDLVDVARLTRGTLDLKRERVPLGEVVAAALELSQPGIEAGNHRVRVDAEARDLVVEADRVRMTQVFSNLLNNAAKYSPPGGRISVRIRQLGEQAQVEVSDLGIGIDASTLPHVFELFVQGRQETDGPNDGLGVGLSLVKRIVEMHGGTTHATSPGPGAGATFVVALPLAPEQPAHAVPPGRASEPGAGAAMSSRLRVLVVDDNRDSAETLGLLLETLGVDNRVALGGAEALSVYEAYRPTAIFLDIGMPGMDGFDVASAVRAAPGGDRVCLVALTGWSQEQDHARTRAAGFDFHMSKPADFDELQRLLALLSEAADSGNGWGRARA